MFLGLSAYRRPRCFAISRRVLEPRVVDFHAQRPGDERPIGAVSAHRLGERGVKLEARLDRFLLEQGARHAGKPAGAGRV